MSGNDPKDTDRVETETAQETSRRDFLAVGAVAVAGAAAAVVAPSLAKAHHVAGEPAAGVYEPSSDTDPNNHGDRVPIVTYHPNEGLVSVIVKAWDNDRFMKNLLSFNADDDIHDLTINPRYPRSKKRLGRLGKVFINKPVVITEGQYKLGYIKRKPEEIVFVVPDTPDAVLEGAGGETGATARALMAAVPFGM